MTDAPEPLVHPFDDVDAAIAFAAERTDRARAREEIGLHVVVRLIDGETTAYARLHDPESVGHLAQRWLEFRRRGVSPGGWSELHHPRAEAPVGPWKDDHELALDRLLIQHAKQAWHLPGEVPYVVEFPTIPLAAVEAG
ncbi:MAG: hypothetical protein JWO69_856 [Thermoleophilia bacterium]|jgi:hypothetical protein|nr:hypothetical protein [Thermoleophilia bacterium]